MYVPALYPEPPVDIVPAKGRIFNVSCASDPSPPIMFKVGVDLKFTPEFVTAIAVITPVFLSNVGVKSAGVVGCPPITSTVGAIEYTFMQIHPQQLVSCMVAPLMPLDVVLCTQYLSPGVICSI